MKKKILAVIVAMLVAVVALAGCVNYSDCPDIPTNEPPTILLSPCGVVDSYFTARLCVTVSDPDGDTMKINLYWRETGKDRWIELVNEVGGNGTYCYGKGLPLYEPYVKPYEDRRMWIDFRADVTDGIHIVSDTCTIEYQHPTVFGQ